MRLQSIHDRLLCMRYAGNGITGLNMVGDEANSIGSEARYFYCQSRMVRLFPRDEPALPRQQILAR